jgi:fibronectin type 3 domain-containing protein
MLIKLLLTSFLLLFLSFLVLATPKKALAYAGQIKPVAISPTSNCFSGLNGVTCSADNVTYNYTIASMDDFGGNVISQEYLIDGGYDSGSGQSGPGRGKFLWTKTFGVYPLLSAPQSPIPCNGGGYGVQDANSQDNQPVLQYYTLMGCSTTVSDTYRYVTFQIRINRAYVNPCNTYVTPLTGVNCNNSYLWTGAIDDFGEQAGFWFLQTGQQIDVPPTVTNASIDNTLVTANGSNQYNISVIADSVYKGTFIRQQSASINMQGPNAGSMRGFLMWSIDGLFSGNVGPSISAGGGGSCAENLDNNGDQYINLISCTASVSDSGKGNTRTVTFTVTFNTNFTSPSSNNTLSGYSYDGAGFSNGWTAFGAFNLQSTTPTSLSAYTDCGASGGGPRIVLSWPTVPNTSYYKIYKSVAGNAYFYDNYSFITSSTDPNIINNTAYSYYVTSVDPFLNESAPSNVVSLSSSNCSPPVLLAPVPDCNGPGGGPRVNLTWSPGNNISYYKVYKSIAGGAWFYHDYSFTNSYPDIAVSSNTAYSYRVSSVNFSLIESQLSNIASIPSSSNCSPPFMAPPTTDCNGAGGTPRINLAWSAISGTSYYKVYKSINGQAFTYENYSYVTSYSDSSLTNGSSYRYQVSSVNAYLAESPTSNTTNSLPTPVCTPPSPPRVNAETCYASTPTDSKYIGNNPIIITITESNAGVDPATMQIILTVQKTPTSNTPGTPSIISFNGPPPNHIGFGPGSTWTFRHTFVSSNFPQNPGQYKIEANYKGTSGVQSPNGFTVGTNPYYQPACANPFLQTQGGDVHSNENINAP